MSILLNDVLRLPDAVHNVQSDGDSGLCRRGEEIVIEGFVIDKLFGVVVRRGGAIHSQAYSFPGTRAPHSIPSRRIFLYSPIRVIRPVFQSLLAASRAFIGYSSTSPSAMAALICSSTFRSDSVVELKSPSPCFFAMLSNRSNVESGSISSGKHFCYTNKHICFIDCKH